MRSHKAYYAQAFSILFIFMYLGGYLICTTTNLFEIGGALYIAALFWFLYVNWVVGIIFLGISGVKYFKKTPEAIHYFISGAATLLVQAAMFLLGRYGVYLSA